MTSKKLLSVCMIVKDEEKNLPRCLDSLKKVFEKIDAELIIVDTGSADSTPEIALKYTKDLYFHQWNNSFSDMRNISISYAKGEWIMIIDADEELENPDELVSLLTSDEVKKYCTVRFKEKNLISIKRWKYITHITERLFKNDGSFKYFGKIHNQPIYKSPVLHSDVWLVHYGYDNEDIELLQKKFKRTSNMLISELEKNPDNVYYRFQLARTYSLIKDRDKALDEIRKAYSSLKEKYPERIKNYYYILGEYAKICFSAKNYEECMKISREGLKIKSKYIDLHCYMGYCFFEKGEKENGMQAFEKYFELYDLYDKGKLIISEETPMELYSLNSDTKQTTAQKIISYLMAENRYGKALPYIDYIEDVQTKIKYVVEIYLKLDMYRELLSFYQEFTEDKEKELFVLVIEAERKSMETEKIKKLEIGFSHGIDSYCMLNKIRSGKDFGAIKKFLMQNNFNKLPCIPYFEVIRELINIKMNPIEVFKEMNNDIIKKYVKLLIDDSDDMYIYFENYSLECKILKQDYNASRVYACVANVLLLTAVEKSHVKLKSIYAELFEKYTDIGINYICLLYQVNRFRIIYKTMDNAEVKFLIILYLANEARLAGNYKIAAKYYIEAAEAYPYLSSLLNCYTKDCLESIE